MGIGEICLLGVGLSMDAFAVSICKGLQMRKFNWKQALWMGIFFGGFQALMPLTGWLLGALFAKHIMQYSHWIAFVLLAFIGGKMLLESIRQKKEEPSEETAVCPNKVDFRELFLLAVATSIDALAVGVTFSIMPDVNIFLSILLIGSITFLFALAGVKIGNLFGDLSLIHI